MTMAGSVRCMDVSAEPQPSDGSVRKGTTSGEEVVYPSKYWLLLIMLVLLGCGTWAYVLHADDPQFSVQVTSVEGLDPLGGQVISPAAFNLTVVVDNRRDIRRFCRNKNTTVALSYDRWVIGWGDLPAFCVGRWSTTDLNVSLAHGGVFLSQKVRESIAADMHIGQLELGVELKPIHPEDAWRACFHSCAVKLGELASPCKRLCLD